MRSIIRIAIWTKDALETIEISIGYLKRIFYRPGCPSRVLKRYFNDPWHSGTLAFSRAGALTLSPR
jgi:hypothetical protein